MLQIRIIKELLSDRSMVRFFLFAAAGVAFSLAVILCSVGLMRGFEESLKKGVISFNGDLAISADRYFDPTHIETKIAGYNEGKAEKLDVDSFLQVDGYALSTSDKGKGVLIRGINTKDLFIVDGKKLESQLTPSQDGIHSAALGKECAAFLGLKRGDYFSLGLIIKNRMPKILRFQLKGIVDHPVYEQDMRFVYMRRDELSAIMGFTDVANIAFLKSNNELNDQEQSNLAKSIRSLLGTAFSVELSWQKYRSLFKAVQIESAIMVFVLQVVIIVAIFNVMAFIVFIYEKKSTSLFLLTALGCSRNKVAQLWKMVGATIAICSIILSLPLVWIFNYLVSNQIIFTIPAEIYYVKNLYLVLGAKQYFMVYALFLVILFALISLVGRKMNKRSIIEQLRLRFK